MKSLRTRPPASNSERQTARLVKQSTQSRDSRKSRVDDKIKKRMSMRYANISEPQSVPNVPVLPTLPSNIRASQHAHTSSRGSVVLAKEKQKEDAHAAENTLLDAEDFDPDAFIKLKLANSTEAELMNLQTHLRAAQNQVASDLQRNVFRNYADFVLVSKEIATLENEMLEFKGSLAEWKGMPSLLNIDESASLTDRRRNVRSSIADLRVLYANQMQTLHTQVEGSAKYVPTMPGRHIVMEMDNIMTLNAATYKVDHSVKFVLLDDALLVARRRKRRNNSGAEKLVAEKCWMLSEMLVLDTKDTQIVTNVFKIRHGKETHVYRTEIPAEKKSLLAQFRHVAEELAAKKRKEREGEHERRKSLWTGGDKNLSNIEKLPSMPDWMAELTQNAGGSNMVENAEGDNRWIGDFADELTIAIALREWGQAVTLLEQGEEKLATMPALGAKLTPLKASLTSALLHSLSSLHNRKTAVVDLISFLLRLDAGKAARLTFLEARTEVTKKRVRMIRFEGVVELYINDLAVVIFTGIKHTADWYLASFKDNDAASCFTDWAKAQIEEYASIFRQQVYTSDIDEKTVDDALMITYNQSKKLLEEYGLDFRFLFQALLVKNPKDGVRSRTMYNVIPRIKPDPIITPASSPIDSRHQSFFPPPAASFLDVPSIRAPSRHLSPSRSDNKSPSSEPPDNVSPLATISIPSPSSFASNIRTPRSLVLQTPPAEPPKTPKRFASSLRTDVLDTFSGNAVVPPPRSRNRPSSSAGRIPLPSPAPQRNGMV